MRQFLLAAAFLAALLQVRAEGAAPLNVRDFGAVGDGTHDDTLAIQKAAKAIREGSYRENAKARRNLRDLRTRNVPSYTVDGPTREVFFPKGVYRVTGPVLFDGSVNLRGENGAVIRNDSPTEDTFYFDLGFRVRVDNLAFEGGCTQLRSCTYNWTDATLFVSQCRFVKSTGPALRLDSYRLNDGQPGDEHKHRACAPFDISWSGEGRVRLKRIDESRFADWYSSTLGTVERCEFVDCVQAFALISDGIIVRDTIVRTSVASSLPVARVGGTVHLDRVRFNVAKAGAVGRPAIVRGTTRSCLTDCEFQTEAPLAAVEYATKACTQYIGGLLSMKDCRVDTRGGVVKFAEACFPNLLTIDGLKGACRGQRLFVFANAPSNEEVTSWPTRHKMRSPRPVEQCIGASILNVDRSCFDVTLPPSLARFVRDYPANLRSRVTVRPDYSVPQGSVLTDAAIGSASYPEAGRDDTVCVQALFDRAARENAAIVELPAAWIETRSPIRVSGRVHVRVRGRAVWRADDAGPALRLAEGCALSVENVVFHRGGNVAWCDGDSGRLTFRNVFFMDQHRESLHVRRSSLKKPGWQIEMDGGVVDTPKLFSGEAGPLFLNGVWLTLCADHPYLKHRPSYVCIENFENGEVVALDVLGVPRYFENKEILKTTPGTVGDYRWIDNFGRLSAFATRFGGERCGITSVYSYPGASTYIEGGFSYHKNNGHLRPQRAAAHLSSERDDVRFVDVAGFNLDEDPSFYVGVQQVNGSYENVHAGHVFNCYPFTAK